MSCPAPTLWSISNLKLPKTTSPVPAAAKFKSSLLLEALILLSTNDIAEVVKSPVTFVSACNSTVPACNSTVPAPLAANVMSPAASYWICPVDELAPSAFSLKLPVATLTAA